MSTTAIADEARPKRKITRPGRHEDVGHLPDKPDLAKDEATEWIRELILSGELQAGEIISEIRLIARFSKDGRGSISRTPIRQALTRLSTEGLVEIMPRMGTRVRLVHSDDAVNIMVLRYAIETVIVCKLAHEYAQGKVDLAPLEAVMDTMREYSRTDGRLTTEERTKFVRADIDFHVKLAEIANCGPAVHPLRTFSGQFLLVGVLSIQQQAVRQQVVGEHMSVLEAIKSGDEDSARQAMHRHLYRTLNRWSPYPSEYLRTDVPRFFGLEPLEIDAKVETETSQAPRASSRRKIDGVRPG